MNIEEISGILKQIKNSISDADINSTSKSLAKLNHFLPEGELKNQCIIFLGNVQQIIANEIKDLNNSNPSRNDVMNRVLKFIQNVENYTAENIQLEVFQNTNLFESVKDILEKTKGNNELTQAESEDLYLESLKIRQELFSEVDAKIRKDYPQIIFSRIFFAKILEGEEIKQITAIPTDASYAWHEKSIIASALALSLIKEFNEQKVQLLINFIFPFEDNVWQRALTGLAIALHNKAHLIKLYPNIETQLIKLQEIPEIAAGLQTIAIELNGENYNGCFRVWHEIIGEESYAVLRNVDSWFIPYFKDNPVIKQVIPKLPDVNDIHLLPDLILKDRHLSNSQKYALVLNIEHFEKVKVRRIIERLKRMKDCTREHVYDPYIADFYWFYKSFSALELEDAFNYKIELYKSKLIDVLIPNELVDVFRGVIEFRNQNLEEALRLLKDKNIEDENIGLDLHEQGIFKYLTFDYKSSIELFEQRLSTVSEKSEKGILYANLSLLYILDSNLTKAKEAINRAFENNEFRYANKNLGYCHLLEGNKSAAITTFQKAIRTFGFDHFMYEMNRDYERLISVINESDLKEILQELKSKRN